MADLLSRLTPRQELLLRRLVERAQEVNPEHPERVQFGYDSATGTVSVTDDGRAKAAPIEKARAYLQ